MYLAFKHTHLLTAVLSLLMTVVWLALAWRARAAANGGLAGKTKATYITHRVTAGLAGITGLGVTFAGPWSQMMFPYIALGAFVVHGVAATVSKRTFYTEQHGLRRASLVLQLGALLFSAYLMGTKPL